MLCDRFHFFAPNNRGQGHPDNVAAIIYGCIQIGIHNGTQWVTERVTCPTGL